jgi:iron complex transport system substrate-binding protein
MKKFAILLSFAFLCTPLILVSCNKATALTSKSAISDETRQIRIASMAPSCTKILVQLGLAKNLVAIDTWSTRIAGISDKAIAFDMMKPDVERLAAIEPDILFVSTITQEGTSKDPFKPLADAGTQVVYMPTSESIQGIRADIMKIAELVHKPDDARKIIKTMDDGIDMVSAIAKTIPEAKKKTVVFEISSAPYIYSFGSGVYLNELLEAVGAKNALGKERGWIAVSGETIIAADPDVILTNVSYLDDPISEISSRPGWEGMKAIRNKRVYKIDGDSSSQPGPDVVIALGEIAKAVYPEYFK